MTIYLEHMGDYFFHYNIGLLNDKMFAPGLLGKGFLKIYEFSYDCRIISNIV
jgi:hypothetical protein